MKIRSRLRFLVLPLLILSFTARAQQPLMNRIPEGVELMGSAGSRSSFSFDKAMLDSADSLIADEDARRAAAAIHGITVTNYHFRDEIGYDPRQLESVAAEYKAAGWKHLVNANQRDPGTGTDLWMHFSGAQIDDVSVLIRQSRQMSFISISCRLRPLDLLHLSGHFGIPKVDPNAVMVPAP
ncbi:hypothetical protein [Terriglobus albidus]|uniref:hypothetical protein n=1 Tax=Terriglobus albidus TaxID=1592106 RepID=UPI0021DFD441|nr:hypothetical protein [Terriglobus albidus]